MAKDESKNNPLSDCFNSLFPDQKELINSKKRQVTYFPRETIFKQGAFASHVIFVVSGLIKLYLQSDSTSRQLNVGLVKAGEFVTIGPAFGKTYYCCSAEAITETTICMIDKGALKKLWTSNEAFALKLMEKNLENEHRLLEVIQSLTFKQMRGKLASALLYLSGKSSEKEKIFQSLSRQNLADFASITIESTVKLLKEFEQDGLVKITGREIYITDPHGLVDISESR